MDIDSLVGDIITGITEVDEPKSIVAAITLAGEIAKDIRRLADAQTLIANIQCHLHDVKVVDGKAAG